MFNNHRLNSSLLFSTILLFSQLSYSEFVYSAEISREISRQLNETGTENIFKPIHSEDIKAIIQKAKANGKTIINSTENPGMISSPQARNSYLIDMRDMNKIISFDDKNGIIEVESGMSWPELVHGLKTLQGGDFPWTVSQRHTENLINHLTVGGSLSSNTHSHDQNLGSMIQNIESFKLINSEGFDKTLSRNEHPELFNLVVGGYGLFGIVTSIKLKLVPKSKIEKSVKLTTIEDLARFLEKDKTQSSSDSTKPYIFKEFEYSIDGSSADFLHKGILIAYKEVNDDAPVSLTQNDLSVEDWNNLYYLAHTDKEKAFDYMKKFHLGTLGKIYWSDQPLGANLPSSYNKINKEMIAQFNGSDMSTEIYVPMEKLAAFMSAVKDDFKKENTNIIYGSIRIIQQDNESFLRSAKKDYAAIIFNIHVDHSILGIEKAKQEFRNIITRALEFNGSFSLNFHKWATQRQIKEAYPEFVEFLRLKKQYDAKELFQSEWYRHYKVLFADEL